MTADVQVDWKLPRDQHAFFFAAEGMLAFFPLPRGRATLAADIGPAQGDHPPLGEPALEDLQAIFSARTPGGVLSDPRGCTTVSTAAKRSDIRWAASFWLGTPPMSAPIL